MKAVNRKPLIDQRVRYEEYRSEIKRAALAPVLSLLHDQGHDDLCL
jgi:hypothetical protein